MFVDYIKCHMLTRWEITPFPPPPLHVLYSCVRLNDSDKGTDHNISHLSQSLIHIILHVLIICVWLDYSAMGIVSHIDHIHIGLHHQQLKSFFLEMCMKMEELQIQRYKYSNSTPVSSSPQADTDKNSIPQTSLFYITLNY